MCARCWVFVSVGVGECQSEDSFVCFDAKPTQRASARDLLRDRKKTREGKVPGQSTVEGSQQKWGEGDSQRKAPTKRGARTCGPRGRVSQRESMSQRSWLLCSNFTRIHAHDNPQKHRMLGKCQKPPPSWAWS